ncbi:hypothetical protein [Tetragenococcus koreensis]|uniref:hypothetical protein n=1 Tax=Tetragenococcus koreensis TaxID=290335 RepID=UPI0011925560|nr:hypothetical protein [Tetragenococcus koreensis]MCF1632174.1 hypothetical protein [Tetragenococcus koreensis]MDN5811334.1 hypothetical protein [Tetragenococcus koreensis]GEN91502.1 hypothetical protein TKO01_15480 [Tetragenococcus koreensis]
MEVASNILSIGGSSRKLPPICYQLVAHRVSYPQYFIDRWFITKVTPNMFADWSYIV